MRKTSIGTPRTQGGRLATNKQARRDYTILEVLEAGIELTGQEVKSAKAGQVSLKGSRVVFRSSHNKPEAFLLNVRISPYAPAEPLADYDPERSRRLLLKRAQIIQLQGKSSGKGLTVVPLSLYTKRGLVKIEIALAKGASNIDKRQRIRERDDYRRAQRELRRRS